MKDHVVTRPEVAPAQDSLEGSIQLLKLDIAFAEASRYAACIP